MVGDTEDAEEKQRSHSCKRGGSVASTARFLTPKVTVYILSTFTTVLSPWPWSSCRRMRWEVMRDFVGFVTALNKRRNVCLSRQAQMDTMKEFKLNVILAPLVGLMCPDCIQHGNLVAWHAFSSLIFVVGQKKKKHLLCETNTRTSRMFWFMDLTWRSRSLHHPAEVMLHFSETKPTCSPNSRH